MALIDGTIYVAMLNDSLAHAELADAFCAPPYQAPPVAPVLAIKPRTTVVPSGAAVAVPADPGTVEIGSAVGLIFGRSTSRITHAEALDGIAGWLIAADLATPTTGHYRPQLAQRGRDGFLPIGAVHPFDGSVPSGDLRTLIDGKEAHRWPLSRLHRDAATAIAEISQFMTFAPGDVLLLGLPHDAPLAAIGSHIRIDGPHGAMVEFTLSQEAP